jgi:hypothetical protein
VTLGTSLCDRGVRGLRGVIKLRGHGGRLARSALAIVLVVGAAASAGKAAAAHELRSSHPLSVQAAEPGKKLGGIVPHYGTVAAEKGGVRVAAAGGGFDEPPTPGPLLYHGGRVMHTTTVRHVFWVPSGYTLPANYQSLIDTFMGDVAADSGKTSNVFASDTQYTDTVTGHILYSLAFGGSVLITDPFPGGATTNRADCPLFGGRSTCLTDTELEQKIENVATAHGWPKNTYTNGYAIFTPPDVDVCIDWAGSAFDHPCTYNAFCAYHTWGGGVSSVSPPPIIYAVEPAFSFSDFCTDDSFSSPNNNVADITINTLNHEVNEFITDPIPTDYPGFGGWFDANGWENADKCAYNYGARIGATGSGAYNQLINGHPYMLQRSWSNAVVPGTGATGCYSIGAPTITNLAPLSVSAGDSVGITGTNFFFPLGTTPVVKFNGINSPSVTVDSPTHLTATVPSGKATGKVMVQGTVGGNATSAQTFGLKPDVSDFGPTSGFAGQTITVNGHGFFGVTSVKFNGVAGTFNTVALDGTSLHALVPAAGTTGAISVTTPGGTGASSTNFTVLPHVTGFTPAAAVAGANVTITGTGFSGLPTVDFTGSPGVALVSHTATSIVVHVPADAVNGPLTVTTADGSSASVASFKPLLKITGFGAVNYQAGNVVTVNGSNFLGTGVDPTAKLGLVSVVPGSVTATSFQFTIPDNGITASVTATNANGTATSPATLKVRPTITGDPAPNEAKAGDHIILTGKTFTGTTSVKFGNNTQPAPFLVGGGGTTLNVTVPNNATTGKIGVTNAGGLTQTANDFTVDPRISAFTPTSGAVGAIVTVNGTGFGSADRVNFAGGVFGVPTNVTATSLKVAVPPGATPGSITVRTPAGTSAPSATPFTVTFSVTGISPTFGGYDQDITVTGVGLTGVTAVKFNNVQGGAITANTGTSFHVTTPDPGPDIWGTVTVWKGLTTNVAAPQQFTKFDVTGFAPTSGVPGAHIVISGHGFTGATHVRFHGTEAAFTVDSDTQINAQVPEAATDGPITVERPGGATATTVDSFTVTAPATVQINEVSPNLAGSADLVELKVLTGGSMNGIELRESPSSGTVTLATLPNVTVSAGDIVVVHLTPPGGVTTETSGKTACSDTACYAGAWDVAGTANSIVYSNKVLTVSSANGTVEDGVAFVRASSGSTSAGFQSDLGFLQSIGAWLPVNCGGSACTDATTPTAIGISADWDGVGTLVTGNTTQRSGNADTNQAADWTVGAESLGAGNP